MCKIVFASIVIVYSLITAIYTAPNDLSAEDEANDNSTEETLDIQLPYIKQKYINESICYGKNSVLRLGRLERTLSKHVRVEDDSPTKGLLIDSLPNAHAQRSNKHCLKAAKASLNLIHLHCQRYGIADKQCGIFVDPVTMMGTELGQECSLLQKAVCPNERSTYRKIDGSCNNANITHLGKSNTGYLRLLYPDYSDGIEQMRRTHDKEDLPNPRTISLMMNRTSHGVGVNNTNDDHNRTLAVMHFGEFISNDLAHTSVQNMITTNDAIECCDHYGFILSPRYLHPACAPISVGGPKDRFYRALRQTCLPYIRSSMAPSSDCSFGPINQLNQATHYLDLSQIYGSEQSVLNIIRKNTNGLLKTRGTGTYSKLPFAKYPLKMCQVNTNRSICYESGDSRVNAHPHLTVLYTIWVREHNRIATELHALNEHWDDEKLFQEAKRITEAVYQNIVYKEWLPIIIGDDAYETISQNTTYDVSVDPRISNEFATAGMRSVFTLIEGTLNLYEENREHLEKLELMNHFNKPQILEEDNMIDFLIRGLATQPEKLMDVNFVDDVSEQLFRSNSRGFGLDICSLDIQRGRDHGLPSYTKYRHMCGLPLIENFDQIQEIPRQILTTLKQAYASEDDVDLLVGGLSETAVKNGLVGPTLACIIAEQFSRTMRGDSYFGGGFFTPEQQLQIRKITLSRVICDNSNIESVQTKSFNLISDRNPLTSCNDEESIPKLDLNAWKTL